MRKVEGSGEGEVGGGEGRRRTERRREGSAKS